MFRVTHRPLAVLAGILLFSATGQAAVPTDAAERAQVIGKPASLVVQPEAVVLSGPRGRQQLVVTGVYAGGDKRDLTAFCQITCENPDLVTFDGEGYLVPSKKAKNGASALKIQAGSASVQVALTVKDQEKPQPISFRNDLIATLNVGGCNAGACHGTPSGKNGFKLSLRGFDPAADYQQLTHDVLGRRTDRLAPESSLLLQKGLGRVPHEGSQRFSYSSLPGQVMRNWLAEGLQDDPANLPELKSIKILPESRVFNAPSRWQQLVVMGQFSDGSIRDVTRLTVFSSSDSAVADVNANGFVEFRQSGEVAILCRYLMELQTIRLTYLEPRPGFVWTAPKENNFVDKFAFAKLKMLSIPPSDLCSDEDFVRRAYLDVCGVLPTGAEVKAFLADKSELKRSRLIDTLLERPEYTDFWTLKWSDILRSNRKTIQVKGIHVFQQWLRGHLNRNTGLDEVVRELLTANGSTFTNPPANYYRVASDPTNLAETTVQLFFGIRMQCAKCHNHPFERWTQDDYYSMAAFFARVKQKKDPLQSGPLPKDVGAVVIFDSRSGEVTQPRTLKQMAPKFMGGNVAVVAPGQDRRQALAEWVTAPSNPFFAKSMANRIWYHLMGRGIVDPVDDFRDSNPSANDELLDALAKDFAASKFDLKHLVRVIMNSRTYQLSALGNELNKDDSKYFSHAVTKLLSAEQLLDAICTATEVAEKFAGMPAGTRATQLPDGEVNHPFLKIFGQPARELACECERESDSNLAQALQLINGPTVNEKLRSATNRIGRLLTSKQPDMEILTELYLSTVSRPPSTADVKVSLDHLARATDKRKAWEDIHWALINSKEFLFRH